MAAELEQAIANLNLDQWQTVERIYQVSNPPRWAHSIQDQILTTGDGWESRPLSLFNIRLWGTGLPTTSPHGTQRVSVPIAHVIESPDDYLIPIREAEPNGHLVQGPNDNCYFELLYLRAADARNLNLLMNYDTWEWLRQWRIGSHELVRLEGDRLRYKTTVAGRARVWYEILVPYQIEFETDPADDETRWDTVALANNMWGTANRRVTDANAVTLFHGLAFLTAEA